MVPPTKLLGGGGQDTSADELVTFVTVTAQSSNTDPDGNRRIEESSYLSLKM